MMFGYVFGEAFKMQPYQKAGAMLREKSERDYGRIKKGLATAATIIGPAAGASILSKALPFLAENIGAETAIKGLKAVHPKFGSFIEEGLKSGGSFDEIKGFIKEKITTAQEAEPQSIFQEIVADYPVDSLDEEGQKQLSFIENVANQLEQKGKDITDPAFKKIKKRVSDLFKGKSGIMMQEMARSADMQQEIANQAEPMQPQQGQMVSGMGPGQKALMDILQRIQQRRGM